MVEVTLFEVVDGEMVESGTSDVTITPGTTEATIEWYGMVVRVVVEWQSKDEATATVVEWL